jgi:hypothetical protein
MALRSNWQPLCSTPFGGTPGTIGTLLGALLPALGVAVIAAFILYYWLPISGELGRQPSTQRRA